MRGTKAKQIRRIIYGDYSHKVRKYKKYKTGTICDIGRRGIYQQVKKQYKNGTYEL